MNRTGLYVWKCWSLCFALALFALSLQGCVEKKQQANNAPSSPAMKLLETPLSALFPPRSKLLGNSQFRLSRIHLVQVNIRRSSGRMDYYRMYRQPKRAWWVIHSRNHDGDWGHPMKGQPIRRIIQSLRNLKPMRRSVLSPDKAQLQVAFFAQGERFLLRLLQAPSDQGIHNGEWLVYHRGELYKQSANGPLSRAIPQLRRMLRRLRARRGWLRMPLNSNAFTIKASRQIAQQFNHKRQSLKRCFTKRRFPAQLGPLRMLLEYSNQGKMVKRKILTKKHAKHKVIWCVWWHVKKWEFKPPPQKSVQFQLVIPPRGP